MPSLPVRVVRQPGLGPRNYVCGHRLHHGMIGAAVVTAGVALYNPAVIAAGVALMAHDWQDFPWLWDTDAYHFRSIGPRTR